MVKSTKGLLELLKRKKLKITLTENYAGRADAITLGINGKHLKPINIAVFLYTNGFESSIQCLIVKIEENKTAECLTVLNELNRRYKWARFSLDPSLAVICEIDVTATSDTLPEITFQMLASMMRTADEAYMSIKQFAAKADTGTDRM